MEIITKRYSPLKHKGGAEVDIYCVLDSLKMPTSLFLLLLRSENSLGMLTRESRSVLSLLLFNILRLLNRSCLIVERKHVFNLLSVENDLSQHALVAGFPNMNLHTEITEKIS